MTKKKKQAKRGSKRKVHIPTPAEWQKRIAAGGLTQSEFCRRWNSAVDNALAGDLKRIADASLSRWIKDVRKPRNDTLVRMEAALHYLGL